MKRNHALAGMLMSILIFSTAVLTGTQVQASTTEEEEETPELPFTTPPETTTPAPTTAAPATAAPPAAGEDFVRARIMLFGVPPNSPNIVTWLNVPTSNATTSDSITATELDATNNVTGDGIGEVFISMPNVTAQVNQQLQGCALDVDAQLPQCDNAFVSATNASTMLQILLGNPSSAAAAAPQ